MRVFIGAGHGGKDPGAVASGLREKNINLEIALAMKTELEKYGITVGMSRTTDVDNPLSMRISQANAFRPDLALDIHTNAGGGNGFEAWAATGKYTWGSKKLAKLAEEEIIKLGQRSRGIKTRKNHDGSDYFGFLRCIRAPAVILEGAFIDSQDVSHINTAAKRQAFGKAYAMAVVRYFGK